MLVYTCTEGAQGTAVNVSGQGYPICAIGGAWVDVQALDATCCTAEQMEMIGVTSEQIAYAFGWGFAAMTLLFWFGFVIRSALNAIKQA